MSYFSIDESMELIKNEYTKKLFKEVHSSYAMGNYRSAVVMLWSVVVTDLVLKLKELESIYNDPIAAKILSDIKIEQSRKERKSSKWEFDIIEKFHKDLNFFGTPEFKQMEYLQNTRHLSAHPLINDYDALHMPSKSEVRSLIQNALEAVLIKDAFYSSRVVDYLIDDISKVKENFSNLGDLADYFRHKYLKNMSEPVLLILINKLWKFSFFLENDEAKKNRTANIYILIAIYKHRKSEFERYLSNNENYISKFVVNEEGFMYLLYFLINNRSILNFFDSQAINLIKSQVKNMPFKTFEYLRFDTPKEYIEYLYDSNFDNNHQASLKRLKKDCEKVNLLDDFLSMCIQAYVTSNTYDIANKRYDDFIKDNINDFKIDHLAILIAKANENSQVCDRYEALYDHQLIIKRTIMLNNSFDFYQYKNFIKGNEKLLIAGEDDKIENPINNFKEFIENNLVNE